MKPSNATLLMLEPHAWSIAVLASREDPTELMATINALVLAAHKPSVIDVLINGNAELAETVSAAIARQEKSSSHPQVRVWFLTLGDKANTWNRYTHDIWTGGELTFFVDGYVRVFPDALDRLQAELDSSPEALAGTGVPSTGRSATDWQKNAELENGLHGNLFAFRKSVMLEFRQRRIKLPLGLYGYDGLLGALIAFGLDPAHQEWDPNTRILVCKDVTWTHKEKKWWCLSDLKTQLQRRLKQSLRLLVVKAEQDFLAIRRKPPEQMPSTLAELVIEWAEKNPAKVRSLFLRSPLSTLALKKLRKPRNWSAADQAPRLVFENRQST